MKSDIFTDHLRIISVAFVIVSLFLWLTLTL